MNKMLIAVLFSFAVFTYYGCAKAPQDNFACTNRSAFSDSTALLSFAEANSIKPVMDSTGEWYQIIDSGTGNKPVFSSNVYVTYKAQLMSGNVFDSATNTNLQGAPIYNLIAGWQIGLTKIGKGGHIKLLVPSTYAYGCTGYGPVGPDQPLYFDIYLLEVY